MTEKRLQRRGNHWIRLTRESLLEDKSMKITELKNKILIAELDPKVDYIILANIQTVNPQSLQYVKGQNEATRKMPVLFVEGDIDRAIRFVKIPKKNI